MIRFFLGLLSTMAAAAVVISALQGNIDTAQNLAMAVLTGIGIGALLCLEWATRAR